MAPRRRRGPAAAAAAADAEPAATGTEPAAAGSANRRSIGVQTARALPNPPEYRPLAQIPTSAGGPLGEAPLRGFEGSGPSLGWQAGCVNTIQWPQGSDRATRSTVVRALAAQVQPALLDYAQFREITTQWLLDFQDWLNTALTQQVEETHLLVQELARQLANRSTMGAADVDVLRARVAQADLRIADLQAWRAQVAQTGVQALAAPQGQTVSIHDAVRAAQSAACRSRPRSPAVIFPPSASGVSTPGSSRAAAPERPVFRPSQPPPPDWRQEDAYVDPHFA